MVFLLFDPQTSDTALGRVRERFALNQKHEARSKGSFHDQECVTCGTVYISEQDSNGQGRLVPLESSNTSTNPPVRATVGQVSIACNINQIPSVHRRLRWKPWTSF